MIKYILDPSVLMQYFVPDTHTAQIAFLLLGARQSEYEIIVPQFGVVECCNVIWQQIKRRGITVEDAETLINDLLELPLTKVKTEGLMKRALRISDMHNLAIYDSLYIALSERLNFPLITADAKQARAATTEGVMLKAITDFAPPQD